VKHLGLNRVKFDMHDQTYLRANITPLFRKGSRAELGNQTSEFDVIVVQNFGGHSEG